MAVRIPCVVLSKRPAVTERPDVWMVPVHGGRALPDPTDVGRGRPILLAMSGGFSCKRIVPRSANEKLLEHEKGIRWMPWHQEAMKDVARCEKPRGAASRR